MAFRTHVVIAATAGVLTAALIGGPAFAHVEVEADKAQAGARDVTLTFHGEAESGRAGIESERVVLPSGIVPADVKLVKAPRSWKFTTGSDGFTVAGPALEVGQDAEFAVRVAQLPTDATTLSFKTLETYSDGDVSRWIDLPEEGQPEPDNPAPTLKLKPAAAVATTSPSAAPSRAPTTDASTAPPSVTTSAADDSSGSAVWWIALLVVIVVVAVGAVLWRRRRNV